MLWDFKFFLWPRSCKKEEEEEKRKKEKEKFKTRFI